MRIAANLFSAGSETTARLIGMCIRTLGDHPEFQAAPAGRPEPDLAVHRGDAAHRGAAQGLVQALAGAHHRRRHRSPARHDRLPHDRRREPRPPPVRRTPASSDIDRPNGRQHLGFGHGIHTCAGAPLARAETHATIVRFLERMSDIRISEAHHGPPADRRYEYDPTYMLRGLTELHIEFDRA